MTSERARSGPYGPDASVTRRLYQDTVAIQAADTSWFNENYTKQAQSVLAALRKRGYAVVPADPPRPLVEKAADELPTGRMNKYDFMTEIYKAIVRLSRKQD